MAVANKRIMITLYSDARDVYCHQVRIALAEKAVGVEILNVTADEYGEDLSHLNPYNSMPTLVDRDLVLFDAKIIMEYLDERFPHPPLLPVYPVARAQSRKMMYRLERDWYSLMRIIENGSEAEAEKARHELGESITSLNPVFSDKPYFLSDEFSMVDCVLAPLLWRLPQLGVQLPKQAKAIEKYMARVFERDAFQVSLTDDERELRAA